MGVVASTPTSHQEWTSASNLVRPSLFSPPELWHDYENPVFVIPDAFQLENEDKRTLIQHHITQGRNFEINRETGNIKKNSMTQKKYSLHSIQPMITIDEKSIKFIPIFYISQANEVKEHMPSSSSSSSGVRQRIENYLKFSLNFKYSANIDCIIYISFSATINNSADNLSYSGTKFTSPALTVAAGQNKTFRSKDHNFYAKFDYFPTLFDWEQLHDSFNARKTKLFDVTVLAMPKTPTSETREPFQAPRQFGFNKRYQSSNHPLLGFPSTISLYRASDTLIRDSTHSVGESSVHGRIHRPFKELHCLQIDLYSLQRTMQFIKQLQLIEEPTPVNPQPTEREGEDLVEVRSSIKTKPSSIVPVLSPPNNLTESTTPSFATLPMSRMNSERQLQRSDSTLPHLMKAKLPQTKDTIVITSSPIQINLLDHYIELSKGVYHMYSTYGADNIKLKDTPVTAPRQPSATKPHPNEMFDSPTRIKPGISYQDRRFSITSDGEERKNDDQDSPQDILHLRRKSLTQHQTPLKSEACNGGSNQNDDSDHYCLICFTNKTDIVLFPCRHYNFCLECSQTLIEKSPNCPVCRVSIKFTIHVPTVEK